MNILNILMKDSQLVLKIDKRMDGILKICKFWLYKYFLVILVHFIHFSTFNRFICIFSCLKSQIFIIHYFDKIIC